MSKPKFYFYRANNNFGFLSNFFKAAITVDGEFWHTSEHYYQAQKFPNHPEIRREIRNTKDPGKVKFIANKKYGHLVDWDRWNAEKDDIMLNAIKLKFSQHDDLKEKLIATGDAELIEHTINDSYWGDGGDETGKNTLGRLLMKIRDSFKNDLY